MQKLPFDRNAIFSISSEEEFLHYSLATFQYQYQYNPVYKQYCDLIGCRKEEIKSLEDIPFLPIRFFKSKKVSCWQDQHDIVFSSSGTTGMSQSQHFVKDLTLYELSFLKAFEHFYGSPSDYLILGLLPSYLEREGSSLIYMVDRLIKASGQKEEGFFLNQYEALIELIQKSDKKVFLIGVSYALMELAEQYELDLSQHIVMETGGMKGKRAEKTKEELHSVLQEGLGLNTVHSEYGMTELLSQAYSKEHGIFETPPWMKILIREYSDPFNYTPSKSGGINVIDLANLHSCSFIATDDLGKKNALKYNQFKILGRLDNSDIRGCNLLIE
ncbi:MAG: acyl transferase [Flavobacteriales bacterium]|nr:acyl transferase [Flavobacteriales bacterium]